MDPLEDVLASLTTEKLVLWRAFLDLEPLPADRDDFRSAMHTAAVMNRMTFDAEDVVYVDELMMNWTELSMGQGAQQDVAVPDDPVAEADALLAAINARFK